MCIEGTLLRLLLLLLLVASCVFIIISSSSSSSKAQVPQHARGHGGPSLLQRSSKTC